MTEIGSYEAKTRLPELLRRIEEGERFRITRNGHPIAELGPVSPHVSTPLHQVVAELEAFGTGRRFSESA